eukprot:GHRQ01038847.1.p2 GENE.GHRQ01038847.1~~GHRQ01038847.1.p2  ORF type:complete len:172 (+),score=19.89 GHRQ01038847.1:370-885(+)
MPKPPKQMQEVWEHQPVLPQLFAASTARRAAYLWFALRVQEMHSSVPGASSCRSGAVVHLLSAQGSQLPVTLKMTARDEATSGRQSHVVQVRVGCKCCLFLITDQHNVTNTQTANFSCKPHFYHGPRHYSSLHEPGQARCQYMSLQLIAQKAVSFATYPTPTRAKSVYRQH